MNTNSLAQVELEKALQARKIGKEGMARVCSRRAAGFAIRDYLKMIEDDHYALPLNDLITNERIRLFLPESLKTSLDHLMVRVNTEYALPKDIDLIADARKIIEILSLLQGANNE